MQRFVAPSNGKRLPLDFPSPRAAQPGWPGGTRPGVGHLFRAALGTGGAGSSGRKFPALDNIDNQTPNLHRINVPY